MTAVSAGTRGPRSAQRRGPKPAASSAVPDGGYPPEQSDRHLEYYRSRFLGTNEEDAAFRTTRALVVAARRWRKLANERIRGLGQTMARWEILFLIGFSGERLTQGQLARLVSVEGSSMVHMLDALARDGLIERQQSEADRRMTTNRITPAGETAVHEIMEVTGALRAELLRGIDAHDLAVTNKVLDQVLRRLDELR